MFSAAHRRLRGWCTHRDLCDLCGEDYAHMAIMVVRLPAF
jgi:hypothetical protein